MWLSVCTASPSTMASRNMREEPATHHHGSRSKPREKSLRMVIRSPVGYPPPSLSDTGGRDISVDRCLALAVSLRAEDGRRSPARRPQAVEQTLAAATQGLMP
jgi:hypothetical protein